MVGRWRSPLQKKKGELSTSSSSFSFFQSDATRLQMMEKPPTLLLFPSFGLPSQHPFPLTTCQFIGKRERGEKEKKREANGSRKIKKKPRSALLLQKPAMTEKDLLVPERGCDSSTAGRGGGGKGCAAVFPHHGFYGCLISLLAPSSSSVESGKNSSGWLLLAAAAEGPLAKPEGAIGTHSGSGGNGAATGWGVKKRHFSFKHCRSALIFYVLTQCEC